MGQRSWRAGYLSALLLTLPVAGTADEKRTDVVAAAVNRQDELEFARQRLRACELFLIDAPKRQCAFIDEPVAKFDNPVSQVIDGFLFLWTDRGRPVAVVKCYYHLIREIWVKSFVSLATRPMEMHVGETTPWAPKDAVLSFIALADAPKPAAQPRQRLAQMREIARRFQVIDHWGMTNPTDWRLRLLTTPLYRYEVPDDQVIDGALFGYVLTTSTEAMLLLEARETATGLAWLYAISPCTGFEIRFFLDGKPIATFPRTPRLPASAAYFNEKLPMADYPYKTKRSAVAPGH